MVETWSRYLWISVIVLVIVDLLMRPIQNIQNTYIHTYVRIYVRTHIYTYIHTYKHTHTHTFTHTHIHTYINTYIHTYIHTHIHTYIHQYIYTYIHTYKINGSVFGGWTLVHVEILSVMHILNSFQRYIIPFYFEQTIVVLILTQMV